MTFVLFVIACLADQPGACKGDKIELPGISNATACHLAGRVRLQEWEEAQPDMRILEATCMGRTLEAEAAKGGEAALNQK